MSLRSYLEAVNGRNVALRLPDMPPSRLERAVRRLEERVEQAGSGTGESFEDFAQRIWKQWDARKSFVDAVSRDLRIIAYNLFETDESGRAFADHEALVDAFLNEVGVRKSPLLISRLAQAYCFGFAPEDPTVEKLARLIASDTSAGRGLPAHLKECKLLNPRTAADLLAAMVNAKDAPHEALASIGLQGPLASSRLVEFGYAAFCDLVIASRDSPERAVTKVLDWAVSKTGSHREAFPRKTSVTADALLLPWHDGGHSPSAEIEKSIKDFLLRSLGDPRFRAASARWDTISPEARAIFKRWLNRASVSQFFDIVDATMSTPDQKRMWRYRRAFWSAYLDVIEDAWVVFGQNGAGLALDAARRSGDDSLREFGKLSTGGASASHAVLIIRMGDLQIAEWSHNGKCRMWSGARKGPEPYRKHYTVQELRDAPWEESHIGNERYYWQFKFASKIKSETGISKRQVDYGI